MWILKNQLSGVYSVVIEGDTDATIAILPHHDVGVRLDLTKSRGSLPPFSGIVAVWSTFFIHRAVIHIPFSLIGLRKGVSQIFDRIEGFKIFRCPISKQSV